MTSGVLKMKMPEIDEQLSDDEIREAIWASIVGQIPILVKQMAADGIFPTDNQMREIAEKLR